MTKGIIFDLGGVILTRWDTGHLHEYARDILGAEKEGFDRAFSAEIPALEKGEVGAVEFWKSVCEDLKVKCPPDDVLAGIFTEEYKRAVKTDEKMVELVKGLKGNGYDLGLVSNTIEDHAKIYRTFGILELFDEVVLSHEVNLIKPDPAIYEVVLERMDLEPQEAVFVDDLQPNIDGADAVGIKGILFENAEQLKQELRKLEIKI